jgi:hypothetical protein
MTPHERVGQIEGAGTVNLGGMGIRSATLLRAKRTRRWNLLQQTGGGPRGERDTPRPLRWRVGGAG